MKQSYDIFPTPVGDFAVALDESGAVLATAFGDLAALRARYTAGDLIRDSAHAAAVRREVAEYFSGQRQVFTVPLAPVGTNFQQRVWKALLEIPFGQTRNYGELAAQMGRPHAARAVGRANATNPISLLVPCHRVIGRDGSLTGYAFGEDRKRRLLVLERAPLKAVA